MTEIDTPAALQPDSPKLPVLAPPGAEDSRGEKIAVWTLFATIVAGSFLLNAWTDTVAPTATPSEADLEILLQQKLADPTVAATVGLFTLTLAGLFAAGSVSALFALVAEAKGQARSRFAELEQVELGGSRLAYFELVPTFLLALILIGGIGAALAAETGNQLPLLLNWLCAGALYWPLLRGKSWRDWRLALGLYRGEGLAAEMWAGLRGYVTAWPLLAFGLALTAALSRLAGQQPTHPMLDWIRDPSPISLVVAGSLAVFWAPICEELVFRGAFYTYLRGSLGKLSAGLLVGLAFAAIHPQGLAGIPFLASLALALALIREWRGSIIASMTVHAVHNGLAFVGLVFMLR